MKTKFILPLVAIAILIASCKKKDPAPVEEEPAPPPPPAVYGIAKDSITNGIISNTSVRLYDYNGDKKLIRVRYKKGSSTSYTSRDTIYYTGSKILKVESYTTGKSGAQAVRTYNYSSDVLTSVTETGTNTKGAYTRTRTFAYSGGKLKSITVAYANGFSDGGTENIGSVIYTGDNMSSADLLGMGAITLTFDTTNPNPYYGLDYDPAEFIGMFNPGNVLKVFMTAKPSDVLINNTYTYVDGRVATIIDSSDFPSWVTTISYKTL